MDNPSTAYRPARAGTVGGTALVVLLQLSVNAVLETMVLAVVGAVVSYGTSMALKRLLGRKK